MAGTFHVFGQDADANHTFMLVAWLRACNNDETFQYSTLQQADISLGSEQLAAGIMAVKAK